MMRRAARKSLPALLLALLLLLLRGLPARAQEGAAQEAPGLSLAAEAGFDGFFKSEFWLPVHVTAANNGPSLEGQLQIATGSAFSGSQVIYRTPISLPTQSNKRVTLYVDLRQVAGRLTVTLLDEDGVEVAEVESNPLVQLPVDGLLYAVVGPDPGELDFLERITGGRSRGAVAFLELDDLPPAAAAWNALDILIFNDVDTGQLSAEQRSALEGWVGTGGQLVVTGGPGWQKTTAALAEMLPVRPDGSQSVDDLPALQSRLGPFRDSGPYVVATSSLRSGELLFHQDGLPLLARQELGRGAVYFLALDPKLAPLADWDGNDALWGEIARRVPGLPYWAGGFQNSYSAGAAVTSLPSLALPSVLQLVLFLFIYILAIGPVNYLFLRRLGRRELAWLTIPALVLFFSALAYATSFQLKGNDIIVNQMSLAYGHLGSPQLRVQSLLGLYSPRRSVYDLHLPADAMARPFDRTSGTMSGGGRLDAVTRAGDLILEHIRVDVSGIETFVADSYQAAPAVEGRAELLLNGGTIELEAGVTNNSDLTLERVTLLLGTTAVPVGDLAPGEARTVNHPLAAAPSGGSLTTPTTAPVPPGSRPLTGNAAAILGTTDYYSDRELYPRGQLLEAVDGNAYGRSPSVALSNDVVTLVAWSEAPQLPVSLDHGQPELLSTTLYLLEIPLEQSVVSGQAVSLPLSFLSWELLGTSIPYDATIQNLYLSGGWVEFEFEPWREFREMAVQELAVALQPMDELTPPPAPQLRLWDWEQDEWVTLPDAGWGQTAVSEPARFLGEDNQVRLHLQDNGQTGTGIGAVYPILTGDLD